MSPDVKHINTNAVAALANDVQYLTEFVDSLENGAMLRENLDELQQTINLMQSDNHDEFFDISIRNKKYGRVDALNGPILLEKYVSALPFIVRNRLTKLQAYFQCPRSYPQRSSRQLFLPIRYDEVRYLLCITGAVGDMSTCWIINPKHSVSRYHAQKLAAATNQLYFLSRTAARLAEAQAVLALSFALGQRHLVHPIVSVGRPDAFTS